jgi:hypothetical protein
MQIGEPRRLLADREGLECLAQPLNDAAAGIGLARRNAGAEEVWGDVGDVRVGRRPVERRAAPGDVLAVGTGRNDALRTRELQGRRAVGEPAGVALVVAGSRTLRWAAVEAANQAWRSSNELGGPRLPKSPGFAETRSESRPR